MKSKYETAMKEKMLITLERDRVVAILAAMPIPGDEPSQTPEPTVTRPKSASQKTKAKPMSAKSEAASEPAQISPSVSSGPDRDQHDVPMKKQDKVVDNGVILADPNPKVNNLRVINLEGTILVLKI